MIKLVFLFIVQITISCSSPNSSPDSSVPSAEPELQKKDTLQWDRPRFNERKAEREVLVRNGIQNYPYQPVKNKKVLDAMRAVPRHLFVPSNAQRLAYGNHPLSIGYGQTISQPFIVAHMTELLNIKPGDKILEIGTGSGYQAAVLSELTPNVYSIEIVEELGKIAKKRLQNLGYKTIKVKIGDGYLGWKEYAPYDGIIVTCAPEDIPQSLIEQLKPGGKIVIPVGGINELQMLVVVEKDKNGNLREKKQYPVRFVPMTGKAMEKKKDE
jgi:protein-L-isoaspartate(D-aspartate) O-methyltransferase